MPKDVINLSRDQNSKAFQIDHRTKTGTQFPWLLLEHAIRLISRVMKIMMIMTTVRLLSKAEKETKAGKDIITSTTLFKILGI